MRTRNSFFVSIVSCIVLASCGSDTMFRGRIPDLPVADIEAAVSAYKAATQPDAEVGVVEVITRNEIRIYQGTERRNYSSMVREKGKWVLGPVMIVHPRY
jgi:hypothetical protein